MGINPIMAFWFSRLAQRGAFEGLRSIIDLGPQDMRTTRAVIEQIVRRHADDGQVDEMMAAFCPYGDDRFAPNSQERLYSLFGLAPYHSIDLSDNRATYAYDLNHPIAAGRQYDVVTNFGTAEHCFNIAAVFESVHNLLRPGGLSLHVLPAFGDIDHGFYNIHPMIFGHLARANGYQIVDVQYVDHLHLKSLQVQERPEDGFDFDGLQISFDDMQNHRLFTRKVTVAFVINAADAETAEKVMPQVHEAPAIVFDYSFVALRKLSSAAFVWPQQASIDDQYWRQIDPVAAAS